MEKVGMREEQNEEVGVREGSNGFFFFYSYFFIILPYRVFFIFLEVFKTGVWSMLFPLEVFKSDEWVGHFCMKYSRLRLMRDIDHFLMKHSILMREVCHFSRKVLRIVYLVSHFHIKYLRLIHEIGHFMKLAYAWTHTWAAGLDQIGCK